MLVLCLYYACTMHVLRLLRTAHKIDLLVTMDISRCAPHDEQKQQAKNGREQQATMRRQEVNIMFSPT